MPCLGLTPFLPYAMTGASGGYGGVNALSRAHSISTNPIKCYTSLQNVSMPCLGLTPFLPSKNFFLVTFMIRCQCPVSGSLHFYEETKMELEKRGYVSMPCLGLTPFLLSEEAFISLLTWLCQCPVSGSLHFYFRFCLLCSVPEQCVNALSRAHSIST